MTNRDIAAQLGQIAELMQLRQENPFKIKAYAKAADAILSLPYALGAQWLAGIKPKVEGVGAGISALLAEMLATGTSSKLEELKQGIPAGVVELAEVPGIGPKKLQFLWKTAGLTSIDDVLEACLQDQLSTYKGFGAKTQAALYNALIYHGRNKGKLLLSKAIELQLGLVQALRSLPETTAEIAADTRRAMPIVARMAIVVASPRPAETVEALLASGFVIANIGPSGLFQCAADGGHTIEIQFAQSAEAFGNTWLAQTAHPEHLEALKPFLHSPAVTEAEVYASANLPYLPPEVRDGRGEIAAAKAGTFPTQLIDDYDVKGILHAHTTYSDGMNTLAEMAETCQAAGYQYLGITDHSASAVYARGLNSEQVAEQHLEIEKLNTAFGGEFKIFKGIESDILRDGNLDYSTEVLKTFDFVIASIHSHFRMTEAEATERIIRAIENPFTTILGHPTGRLLLSREGYRIDHLEVIEAAARNGVAIELNCNPWRLDLDWTWIRCATERGVRICLSPDAHSLHGLLDISFGVRVGRKGWLTPEQTLNCLGPDAIAAFFKHRKK